MQYNIRRNSWRPNKRILGFFLYLLSYQILSLVFFSIIISLIYFFHFLLGHSFSEIEAWIFRQIWTPIILAKIPSLLIINKFFSVKSLKSWNFNKDVFIGQILEALPVVGVGLLFMWTMIFIFFQPSVSHVFDSHSLLQVGSSYLGVSTLLITDIIFLSLFDFHFPLRRNKDKIFILLIIPLVFYGGFQLTLNLERTISSFLYCGYLLSVCIFLNQKHRIHGPLLFILCFVAPVSSLFDQDPFWQGKYSPFAFGETWSSLIFMFMSLTLVTYYSKDAFRLKR